MSSRHRHRNSMDGSMLQVVEAKKAMAPDNLAEIWTVDPKRAKRILEKRQSAAHTKERKACYIIELEKVQTLQTEATTLSAQPTLFQRGASGLTTEKTDLKLQLQAMEQQAHLRDALNEAMKNEVERLKVATGEVLSHADNFNLGMSHVPFTQSSFSQNRLQPGSGGPHNKQMLQFHPFQSNMSNSNQQMLAAAHSNVCSDMLQRDPLGRFQGLDINSRDLI